MTFDHEMKNSPKILRRYTYFQKSFLPMPSFIKTVKLQLTKNRFRFLHKTLICRLFLKLYHKWKFLSENYCETVKLAGQIRSIFFIKLRIFQWFTISFWLFNHFKNGMDIILWLLTYLIDYKCWITRVILGYEFHPSEFP